jgi:hypothetical protein
MLVKPAFDPVGNELRAALGCTMPIVGKTNCDLLFYGNSKRSGESGCRYNGFINRQKVHRCHKVTDAHDVAKRPDQLIESSALELIVKRNL